MPLSDRGFYVLLLIEPPTQSVYLVRVAETGVADHNQRAQERSKVMLMVAARFAGDPHVHRLRARDIAAGGVRLAFRGDALPGDAVTVEFAAIGAVPGVVAWATEGEIGVRFAETIDPERARLPVTGDFRAPIPRHAQRALRRV